MRDRILDAALQIFGNKGYSAATTREIAEKAHVNEVTIFRRFGSKRELFEAVLIERSPLIEVKHNVMMTPEGPVDELIFQNMKTVLGILRSNRHFFVMVLSDAWKIPETREFLFKTGIQKGIDLLSEMLSGLMEAGILRDMNPRIAARSIMGLVQAYFITNDLLEGRRVEPVDENEVLRGFVSIFLDGLRSGVELK